MRLSHLDELAKCSGRIGSNRIMAESRYDSLTNQRAQGVSINVMAWHFFFHDIMQGQFTIPPVFLSRGPGSWTIITHDQSLMDIKYV